MSFKFIWKLPIQNQGFLPSWTDFRDIRTIIYMYKQVVYFPDSKKLDLNPQARPYNCSAFSSSPSFSLCMLQWKNWFRC